MPLDGRPHAPAGVRSYLGDSRGRWEGDTLVVETTNFRSNVDETSYNCCGSPASTCDRRAVHASSTRTRSTTVHGRRSDDLHAAVDRQRADASSHGPIFEYACHEGNRAMEGILRGGRAQEKKKGITSQQGARH